MSVKSDRIQPNIVGVLRGHEGVVTSIFFVNETDDAITVPSLISGSDCGEIFIWNMKTKRAYYRIKGHNGKMILYVCYHKTSLISQGRDGNIYVWKLTDEEWAITRSFQTSSYGFCASVLFSNLSTTYLVAPTGDQSALTFFDFDTSKVLNSFTHSTVEDNNVKSGREMCICMKAFTKETKIFLIMGYDSGYLSLWDYESNKEKSRLKCHAEIILCLDFDSTHRNKGISGSVDDVVQVWKKTEDDQLVKSHQFTVTNPGVSAVKIRGDGKRVIIAGQDGAIRLFNWKSCTPIYVTDFHKQPIFCLSWKNETYDKVNPVIFAAGCKDKNISLGEIFF